MNRLWLLALMFAAVVASAQVAVQEDITSTGQHVVRFHNNTNHFVSCVYKDKYNYYTFNLAPQRVSMWYPVYGKYQWRCSVF